MINLIYLCHGCKLLRNFRLDFDPKIKQLFVSILKKVAHQIKVYPTDCIAKCTAILLGEIGTILIRPLIV